MFFTVSQYRIFCENFGEGRRCCAQISSLAHRQIVVSCPIDLHRVVGQTKRCTFSDQGQGWWLDASVVPAGSGTDKTYYQVQPEWTPLKGGTARSGEIF
jgi:hypothetical protein